MFHSSKKKKKKELDRQLRFSGFFSVHFETQKQCYNEKGRIQNCTPGSVPQANKRINHSKVNKMLNTGTQFQYP